MGNPPSSAGIAAPAPWLFGLLHTSVSAVPVAALLLLLATTRASMKPSMAAFVIVPPAVLFASRWIGRAPSFLPAFGRSFLAHAGSAVVASFLMAIGQMNRPGASGHGGIFLVLLLLVPMAVMVSAFLALVASAASLGLMRVVGPKPHP